MAAGSGALAADTPQAAPSQVATLSNLLGSGAADPDDTALALERARTLAALDQRIADLRQAGPAAQSDFVLDYLETARAALVGP